MQLTKKPAIAAAACLALAGGGTGAAVLATSADASTTPAHAQAVEHGTGTATLTLTGASGKTRTLTPGASCKVLKNGDYVLRLHRAKGDKNATGTTAATTVATSSSAKKKGHKHGRRDESLVIRGYHGAGSYSGVLRITRHEGRRFEGRTVKVPVTLTSDGGSFSFSKTLSGKKDPSLKGKTVSEKATWTCAL